MKFQILCYSFKIFIIIDYLISFLTPDLWHIMYNVKNWVVYNWRIVCVTEILQ